MARSMAYTFVMGLTADVVCKYLAECAVHLTVGKRMPGSLYGTERYNRVFWKAGAFPGIRMPDDLT